MTRTFTLNQNAYVIPDLDDFRPHDFDPTEETPAPEPTSADVAAPELCLCVAGHSILPGRPLEPIRPLAELVYRIEEALLARYPQVRRALCCGALVEPFADITMADALPPDVFRRSAASSPTLLNVLSQACAVMNSFSAPSGVPSRLLLLTELAPDALPLPMLQLLTERLYQERPALRIAVVHCGASQTAWAAYLRELEQRTARPIPLVLPDELHELAGFLFAGGES